MKECDIMALTNEELQAIRELFLPVYTRLDGIENEIKDMSAGLGKVEDAVRDLDVRLDKVEDAVKDVRLTLENETNRSIQIIAEGHLDLTRKLDDALKVENERKMLLLRVNRLEMK